MTRFNSVKNILTPIDNQRARSTARVVEFISQSVSNVAVNKYLLGIKQFNRSLRCKTYDCFQQQTLRVGAVWWCLDLRSTYRLLEHPAIIPFPYLESASG